jgi:hypothetical protein
VPESASSVFTSITRNERITRSAALCISISTLSASSTNRSSPYSRIMSFDISSARQERFVKEPEKHTIQTVVEMNLQSLNFLGILQWRGVFACYQSATSLPGPLAIRNPPAVSRANVNIQNQWRTYTPVSTLYTNGSSVKIETMRDI